MEHRTCTVVQCAGFQLEVVEIEGHRVEKAVVTRLADPRTPTVTEAG